MFIVWRGTGTAILEAQYSSRLRAYGRRSCMRYLLIYTRLMTRCNRGYTWRYWKVKGWSPCLMYPDPLLGLGKYGGNGKRILRGPLPGVLGCHPGGGTAPPDLQFCSRRDCLSLVWGHGSEWGRPWKLQIYGDGKVRVILLRWRPQQIYQSSEAVVGLWRTNLYIKVGWAKK